MKQLLKLCHRCAVAAADYQGTNVYIPVTRRRPWKMGAHLGKADRETIAKLRREGTSLKRIAVDFDLPYASLCREFKGSRGQGRSAS